MGLPAGRGGGQLPGVGVGQLDRSPQGRDLLLLPRELLVLGADDDPSGGGAVLCSSPWLHEVTEGHHHIRRRILLQVRDLAQHHARGVCLYLNAS